MNGEQRPKFLGFYNKYLAILAYLSLVLFSFLVLDTLLKSPFFDEDYYVFHPHEDDTCEILQSKLDLFHPHGTNPIKFEILKEMFESKCEVVIR